MSSTTHAASLIIEWSPRTFSVFDVASRTVREHEAIEPLPYSGKTAILAISRKSIFVRATRVPNAAPEELRLVVQVKLAELFPLPPSDLAYDFMLLSDVSAEGRLALIMAMPVLELRRAQEKMASSGIRIVRTLPLALAAPIIAESVGLQDAAVVEGSTDFASVDLVAGGILRYSRVIPPGAPLDVEVHRTYNASGLTSAPTIAAGHLKFPEADKATSLTSLQALASGSADRLRVNIELPEVVASRELYARKRRQIIAATMLLFSFVAAFLAYSDRADAQAKTDLITARYQKDLAASTTYEKAALADETRQAAIADILNAAFHPAQTVSDIALLAGNSAPPEVWLTGLNVERGKEITIRGTATTSTAVSTYVESLGSFLDPVTGVARFRNARLLVVNNGDVQKTAVVDFSISAFPVGNLPIALQQKSGASAQVH